MNRNDRRIALTAIAIAALALIALWLTENNNRTTAVATAANDSITQQHDTDRKGYYQRSLAITVGDVPTRHTEEFPFDPNTADSTQLLRLGLQPWQVRSIYRYRARGGVFRSKRDFAQLYGLTKKDYLRLEPYIRISDDYQAASTLFPKEERDTLRYPAKLKNGEHIVLNTADTTQLMKVPGIGSYVSVDQLDEIDGFPQTAKQYFIVDHPTPQRLNINRLSLKQLRNHPYINYYQAKAIVDYRRLHGDIKSLQDLRFSKDFTEGAIRRLEPYIEY